MVRGHPGLQLEEGRNMTALVTAQLSRSQESMTHTESLTGTGAVWLALPGGGSLGAAPAPEDSAGA